MRILSLTASNVMRLVAVEIHPTSNVVQITGKNGAGKTAVLDCIWWALAGKPGATMPVRKGEEQAVIRLDLGDVVVTRTFKKDGTTQLTLRAADGAKYDKPQTMLDKMLGSVTLTFDPMAFALMPTAKQFEELRKIVPLDTDVDALDRANERDRELRKGFNSKRDSLTERLALLAEGVDPAMDVESIDISALLGELETAAQRNADRNRESGRRDDHGQQLVTARARAAQLREDAAKLIADADRLDRQCDEIAARIAAQEPLPELIDTSALRRQIDEARKTNTLRERQADKRAQHQMVADELQDARATAENLTAAMDERTRQKQDAIARAAMPVEGLSFGDGEVLLDGVPFSQASTAQQIRVGFQLAIARRPTLRVIRIQDGSLLDDDSMALIAVLAERHDMQVWVEVVDRGQGIGVLIEEGQVAAVDGVRVEALDPSAEAVAS